MAEKKRPGVMFYFETRPCLRRLSLEEKGLLLEAALDYAQYGQIPELDGMAGMAWDFIQPRVDRDGERYEQVRQARSKAARKRWESCETGEQPEAPEETPEEAPEEMQEDAVQETQLHPEPVQTDATASDALQKEAPDAPPEQENRESWWEDVMKDANAFFAEQTMPTTNPNSNPNSNPDSYSNSNPNLIHPISAAERQERAGDPEMRWEELRRRKIGMLSGWMPAAQDGTKPPPGGATALDGERMISGSVFPYSAS